MHSGLGIYQIKYTARPHFLPYHAFLHNIQLSSSGQKNIIMSEIATNPLFLQNCNWTCKNISIFVVLVSIKYRWREKNCAAREVDPTINFDLMINFDFFDLITWDSLMVWAWNLVCGRFINFRKGRKFLTFGCPTDNTTSGFSHTSTFIQYDTQLHNSIIVISSWISICWHTSNWHTFRAWQTKHVTNILQLRISGSLQGTSN